MKPLATSLAIEALIALFLAGTIQATSSRPPNPKLTNFEQCLLSYQEGDLEKARRIAQIGPKPTRCSPRLSTLPGPWPRR